MIGIDATRLLLEIEQAKAAAQGAPAGPAPQAAPEFGEMLRAALDQVNGLQQRAAELAHAFEAADRQVDLAQVMIALQKANVSFQAMVQVRNKLVSAYQEIMNMQV